MTPRPQEVSHRRPAVLHPGDLVAVVAPAGPVPEAELRAGLGILEGRYRVVHDEAILARQGYLAGSDERRAAELNRCLRDPRIRGIVCARGGYGLLRILSALDAPALARDPRPIIGFSDVTVLLCWALAQAGVRGVHGPVVTQLGALPSGDVAALFRLLEDPAPPGAWATGLRPVRGGRARGLLVGGNLEVLSRLLGTAYLPRLAGAILFLEEVGERPYRIDRTLTQLLLAGALDGVAGVVVGSLLRCEEPDGSGPRAEEVVAERLSLLGVPVCFGLPCGHGQRNLALPFGGLAVLDADHGTLTLEESAVVGAGGGACRA